MNENVSVLDHGYVKFIESWGSDERIVEAARMSTGRGFKGWGPLHTEQCVIETAGLGLTTDRVCSCPPGDEKLLRFLYEHRHMTPFEMGGLIIEVQAPIFVFREWHRHRTQSYNEMSARYEPLPDVNYVPSIKRLMVNAGGSNKQAGTVADAAVLTQAAAEKFQANLMDGYHDAQLQYEHALEVGVPKELARVGLPVGRYSRMRASANLRNWLQFLTLRQDAAAQWEIRQYANAVGGMIDATFPRTWTLFVGRA